MAKKNSFGICELCGARQSKAGIMAHLCKCLAEGGPLKGSPSELLQLRVQAKGSSVYWIDLEVRREARLKALDDFLRRVWLECCGHLSAFHINGVTYSVVVDRELGAALSRSMNCRIGDVLTVGERFRHEYDFGSTTELTGQVWGLREGVIGRPPVRALARNEAPVWPCEVCGAPATLICGACADGEIGFCCDQHADQHGCGEEAMLPVVNSPRMGVCGYTGEA